MSIGGFDLESTHSRSGREHVTAFHLISPFPFPFPLSPFPFPFSFSTRSSVETRKKRHITPYIFAL